MVERSTVNRVVTGSNPVGGVTFFHYNSVGRVPYIGRHWSWSPVIKTMTLVTIELNKQMRKEVAGSNPVGGILPNGRKTSSLVTE